MARSSCNKLSNEYQPPVINLTENVRSMW